MIYKNLYKIIDDNTKEVYFYIRSWSWLHGFQFHNKTDLNIQNAKVLNFEVIKNETYIDGFYISIDIKLKECI